MITQSFDLQMHTRGTGNKRIGIGKQLYLQHVDGSHTFLNLAEFRLMANKKFTFKLLFFLLHDRIKRRGARCGNDLHCNTNLDLQDS